jgi:hypothetical protein
MDFNLAKNIILKALPVGTVRNRKGGKYKKVGQGKWEKVVEEKQEDKTTNDSNKQKAKELTDPKRNLDKINQMIEDTKKGKTGYSLDKLNKLKEHWESKNKENKKSTENKDEAGIEHKKNYFLDRTPEENRKIVDYYKKNFNEKDLDKRSNIIDKQIELREKQLKDKGIDYMKPNADPTKVLDNLFANKELHDTALFEIRMKKIEPKK